MTGHNNLVRSAAFSPDGKYIASGSFDYTIRFWDAQTGHFIRQLANQGDAAFGLSFSPDSRMLLGGSASAATVCHVFEVPSGRAIASFSGNTNAVVATAFAPDGRTVATAGGDQNKFTSGTHATAE
jgi:WD40 repeat protein